MIKLFEHKVRLKESFSESMPDWIRNQFTKKYNAWWRTKDIKNSIYDLYNAEFHECEVPNYTDPLLKDSSKLFLFVNDERGIGQVFIYDPEYGTWSPDDDLKYLGSGLRRNSKLKNILPHFTKCAWVDKSYRNNAQKLRQQRKDSRKGMIARAGVDVPYDGWSRSNYDKSGYKLDRGKYKRMLAELKLDKYEDVIDDAFDLYGEALNKIKLLRKSGVKTRDIIRNSDWSSRDFQTISMNMFSKINDLEMYANRYNSEEDKSYAEEYIKDDVRDSLESVQGYVKDLKKLNDTLDAKLAELESPVNESIKLNEKNWKFTLPRDLRDAIEDEDYERIFDVLKNDVQMLFDKGIMDEDDYEDFIDNIDNEYDNYLNYEDYDMDWSDVEDNVNYLLDDFYDFCDATSVFIEL